MNSETWRETFRLVLLNFTLFDDRSATIQSYLRGVREAPFSTLARSLILFRPHPLGSWRTYITLEVAILLYSRCSLELFSFYYYYSIKFLVWPY